MPDARRKFHFDETSETRLRDHSAAGKGPIWRRNRAREAEAEAEEGSLDMEAALESAIHEAGHAVVILDAGGSVDRLSVSADGLTGQCVMRSSWRKTPLEHRRAVVRLGLGGILASAKMGGTVPDFNDPRFKSDMMMIEGEVGNIYMNFLHETTPKFPLVSVVAKIEILATEEILAAHWTAVWVIARELFSQRIMKGERAKQIFCDAKN